MISGIATDSPRLNLLAPACAWRWYNLQPAGRRSAIENTWATRDICGVSDPVNIPVPQSLAKEGIESDCLELLLSPCRGKRGSHLAK